MVSMVLSLSLVMLAEQAIEGEYHYYPVPRPGCVCDELGSVCHADLHQHLTHASYARELVLPVGLYSNRLLDSRGGSLGLSA
jgi:hypothetical protein